jgi:hypothetical protein
MEMTMYAIKNTKTDEFFTRMGWDGKFFTQPTLHYLKKDAEAGQIAVFSNVHEAQDCFKILSPEEHKIVILREEENYKNEQI